MDYSILDIELSHLVYQGHTFCQISLKILLYLTDFSLQIMAWGVYNTAISHINVV